MKVALLSPLPPPAGGIAAWTKEAVSFFTENAIEVRVVNNAVVGKRRQNFTAKTTLFDEILRTQNILRDLKQTLKKFRPDILHLNTSCGAFGMYRDLLCVYMAKKRRVSCALHCHCDVQSEVRNSVNLHVFRRMVQAADLTFVLNERALRFTEPTAPNKVLKIANFISPRAEIVRKEIAPEIRRVVFVGHVRRGKGCIEIIEAAKQCPKIEFILVGPIDREIGTMPRPENVILTGEKAQNEVQNYLKSADVFLLPSYAEGFSRALLEAMRCGLPVIATDVGANAEMLGESGGILVPVGDASAIVKAISALQDPNLRETMAARNREKVKMCYLREPVMRQIVRAYETVLKGRAL